MKKDKFKRDYSISNIYKGISYNNRTGKWVVYVNNKCVGLTFNTEEEAFNAAKSFFEKTTGISLNTLNDFKNDINQSYMKEYYPLSSEYVFKKIMPRINYSSYIEHQKEKH